ncbi:YugN family protein [Sporosarcina aquimarina]|uniref:YugN family protein n=1 Tax=Sporosarcina aquimarina TaxID=114975 RepID=A0ABU4FXA0_9BACL|nr:YugN family protein [Sporosarcina aquimarina]MDW0109340.1 YugN family protein [Sporosarcina aquimarina]
MDFINTGIEEIAVDIRTLEELVKKHDLVLAGQWDYERMTFDKKYTVSDGVYYLRVYGITPGDVGKDEGVVEFITPQLGKHYYPHGVEYGEDEFYPAFVVNDSKKTLAALVKDLQTFNLK